MAADDVQVLRNAYDAFARQDMPAVLAAFDEDITELLPMDQAAADEPYRVSFSKEIPPPLEDVEVFVGQGDTRWKM